MNHHQTLHLVIRLAPRHSGGVVRLSKQGAWKASFGTHPVVMDDHDDSYWNPWWRLGIPHFYLFNCFRTHFFKKNEAPTSSCPKLHDQFGVNCFAKPCGDRDPCGNGFVSHVKTKPLRIHEGSFWHVMFSSFSVISQVFTRQVEPQLKWRQIVSGWADSRHERNYWDDSFDARTAQLGNSVNCSSIATAWLLEYEYRSVWY